MDGPEKEKEKSEFQPQPVTTQVRAETMAYALQSGMFNLGANFFEPWVNYRIQRRHSEHDPNHPGYGNYGQNLAGEFAGDIIGMTTLILSEALVPHQLHACTRTMRRWIDPLYTSVAHRVFAAHEGEPGYEKEMNDWKIFQERNLVRSLIVASAGITGNVATQKLIGNPSPTNLIFRGKLAGTAITTALGLTARILFPDQMKGMDYWVGKNIFAPMLSNKPDSHVDKLTSEPGQEELKPAR